MARKQHSGVSEQIKASRHRLEDAEALFAAGRWRGAMYVAGYAVECLLKAKLMQRFGYRKLEVLEDQLHQSKLLRKAVSVFTHELETLTELLGALDRIEGNKDVYAAYLNVNEWQPAWRYNPDLATRAKADLFIGSIKVVREWIMNNV
jgi:HEPN domain-containing protein